LFLLVFVSFNKESYDGILTLSIFFDVKQFLVDERQIFTGYSQTATCLNSAETIATSREKDIVIPYYWLLRQDFVILSGSFNSIKSTDERQHLSGWLVYPTGEYRFGKHGK